MTETKPPAGGKKPETISELIDSLHLQRIYFLPLIIGAVILLLVVLVVRPQVDSIRSLRQQVETEKSRLKLLKEKASLLEGTSADELTKDVELVESVLPSEKPAVQVINTVSQLAAKGEVVFSGVDLSPGLLSTESAEVKNTKSKASAGEAQFLKAGFTVSGDKAKIFSFLDQLERATPVMKIEGLSLSLLEGLGLESVMTATVNVSVFYQPTTVKLGKLESSLPLLTPVETETLEELASFQFFPKFKGLPDNLGKDNLFSF